MNPAVRSAIPDKDTCKETTLIARDATKEETDWLEYEDKAQKELGSYFITESDKYATIFTTFNTIYMGLLVFFGLVSNNTLTFLQFPVALVFAIPLIPWIIGLAFFSLVKNPRFTKERPYSPTAIRETLYNSNVEKATNYRIGLILFAAGIVLIPVALVAGAYISALPAPSTPVSDVQFIINGEQVPLISQIPIDLVSGTNKTVNVTLLNMTDTGYQVKIPNGDTVTLEKTWITTIIYKPSPT